jgi:hypothetical protein
VDWLTRIKTGIYSDRLHGFKNSPPKRLSQKSFFGSPTTEAVGSNFVTSIEPTALVVGAQTNIWQQFERKYF